MEYNSKHILQSKPHYAALDGLRGIAAIVVVCFHLFEAHASSRFDQIINHGYLAVDFFFILSGFVIGYAYDDRWGKMTITDFFKRRLIRLQPMIVLGGLIGAVLFYFGHGSNVEQTSIAMLLVGAIAACLLLPLPMNVDIRGWQEMYPLNGPQWSLFFEYIANILYALIVRRFSNRLLSVFVFAFGCLTVFFLMTNPNGDMIGGWALTQEQLYVGFVRLLYPFFAGLLLSRLNLSIKVPHPFLVCSIAIVLLLAMPRIGDEGSIWMNAIYESLCILVLFPIIVIVGSSSKTISKAKSSFICNILGRISYPIYLIHYPFIYLYFKYVYQGDATIAGSIGWGVGILVISVLLAYISEKVYDLPIRNWLRTRTTAIKKIRK